MKALFFESLPYRSAVRVGSHHYAARFLEAGWEGMWLSQPISPLHFVHPVKRDWDERVAGWRSGAPVDRDGMRYYSPLTMLPATNAPLLRSRAFARASAAATVPSARGVIERAGFSAVDLAWVTNPVYAPLAEKIHARVRAVRIADDLTKFANIPASIAQLEQRAIEGADVVFAVASTVAERLQGRAKRVVHLPNGCDFERFATPGAEPQDLAALPHPRIVYVGAMEYWFDAELLADAARSLPEASFVVIGPDAERPGALEGLHNVHLLGRRRYEQVPAYLQHCDIGIVPFRRDPMIDAVQPIKVYEYLAAGLPVVAIRWTELEAMASPALLADRPEFVDLLAQTAEGVAAGEGGGGDRADAGDRGDRTSAGERTDLTDAELARAERQAYARANSWDRRFELVRAEVDALLAR